MQTLFKKYCSKCTAVCYSNDDLCSECREEINERHKETQKPIHENFKKGSAAYFIFSSKALGTFVFVAGALLVLIIGFALQNLISKISLLFEK